MTPAQEQSAFPTLLQLYDQTSKEVAGQFFLSRKLNLDELLTAGFIEKRGRYTTFRLEDEGIVQEVDVRTAGRPSVVYYEHPVDGARVELPITAVEKYAIKRDWLNEIVLNKLGAFLLKPEPQELDKNLILLGQIKLGADFLRRLNSDRARISFGFGAPSANDLDAEPEDSALDDSTEPLWSQDQDLFAQSDTLHDLQIALAYMNDEQRNLFELLKVHQTLPDACKACGTASATFYRRFADLQMHLRMFGFKAAA